MEATAHLAELDRHGRTLADAAQQAGLETRVPSCPEWTVRELVAHVGTVHRWASATVRGEKFSGAPAPPDDELIAWFRAGHSDVVEALRAAPAELQAMTFLADAGAPREFWIRRQAHETAMHSVDAAAAAGAIPVFDAAFALDGIAELLEGFYARAGGTLTADPPFSLRIAPSDGDVSWLVTVRADGRDIVRTDARSGDADCTLAGASADLYLQLWNRTPRSPVEVIGDASVDARWKELARISWS